MVYNSQNVLYIIVIVVIYLSYTRTHGLALWDDNFQPPNVTNVTKTCIGWLEFHNILGVNIKSDIRGARRRTKAKDPEVHVFAAAYAYLITSIPIDILLADEMSPPKFCKRLNGHKEVDNEVDNEGDSEDDNEEVHILFPYTALKDAKLTCGEWIRYYGYTAGIRDNQTMATSRVRRNDLEPHLLVTLYSSFMVDTTTAPQTPLKFCDLIGMSNMEIPEIPFLTLNTKKSCQDWIYFSGYTTFTEYNIQKAQRQRSSHKLYLNKYTYEYIDHLLNTKEGNENQTGCCFRPKKKEIKPPLYFCSEEQYITEYRGCYYNGAHALPPF